MKVRLRGLVLRLALLAGGTAMLAVGLTACAVSPSTTTSASVVMGETTMPGMDMTAMSHHGYEVEVIFQSTVVAGNNQVTVRVHDAATGEPLHNAAVSVSVNERAHTEAATDNHDSAETESHPEAEVANHDPMDAMGHAEAEVASHDPMDAMGPMEAEEDGHDGGHTMGAAEAEAEGQNSGESVGHGHASPAVMTLVAGSVPGEYLGQVEVPDVGEWLLTIQITAEGEEQEAKVAITAVRDKGRMIALGGFLSLNIAIVAIAAITKRKTVKG
jgi:hypothetical protein